MNKWYLLKYVLITFFIITIAVISMIFGAYLTEKKYSNIERTQVIISEQIAFEDSVKLYIEQLNIAHPEIVFKQARIESGNFTSRVFKENNNMFGMRVPQQRPNLSIGKNRGYAVYKNWQHSVIDYALLQSWSYKKLDKDQYLQQLDHSYAEDTLYIQKLK